MNDTTQITDALALKQALQDAVQAQYKHCSPAEERRQRAESLARGEDDIAAWWRKLPATEYSFARWRNPME